MRLDTLQEGLAEQNSRVDHAVSTLGKQLAAQAQHIKEQEVELKVYIQLPKSTFTMSIAAETTLCPFTRRRPRRSPCVQFLLVLLCVIGGVKNHWDSGGAAIRLFCGS